MFAIVWIRAYVFGNSRLLQISVSFTGNRILMISVLFSFSKINRKKNTTYIITSR